MSEALSTHGKKITAQLFPPYFIHRTTLAKVSLTSNIDAMGTFESADATAVVALQPLRTL